MFFFFFSSRRRHTRSVSAFPEPLFRSSRFKSLDTLKVKIISVTFRRVIRTNHKKPPRFGGMKTYNWEGVNPDGYFLDKLEPIPSALPSFQKLFQVSATALSIP